jgi:hypothetical protein
MVTGTLAIPGTGPFCSACNHKDSDTIRKVTMERKGTGIDKTAHTDLQDLLQNGTKAGAA